MRVSFLATCLALYVLLAGCTRTATPPAASTPEAGAQVNPGLENKYWKLIQLGDSTDIVGKGRQEPHFTLRPDDKLMEGTGGCNQMGGAYTLKGDELSFGQMRSTMMACAQGMEQEQAFSQAMQQVKRWRIEAGKLELLDASGRILARFEARD